LRKSTVISVQIKVCERSVQMGTLFKNGTIITASDRVWAEVAAANFQ